MDLVYLLALGLLTAAMVGLVQLCATIGRPS